MGIEYASGSPAVRVTTVATLVKEGMPARIGKYMAALTGWATLYTVSPTTPMIWKFSSLPFTPGVVICSPMGFALERIGRRISC